MLKQQTEWIWRTEYAEGTGIKIGWNHNKQKGVLDDLIRVKIDSKHCNLDFNMRLDEAASMVAGIGKTTRVQANQGRITCQV